MRPVDADAITTDFVVTNEATNAFRLYISYEQLKNAPTIDLVKHGHWVDTDYYDLKCSKCGERPLYYFNEEELDYYLCRSKYCPHCGAKMDEVTNEQE